jgi:hypothetical protein
MTGRGLRRGVFVPLVLLVGACCAQDQCTALAQAKARTYGFHPSTLTKEQRPQKSKQMDEFWNLVEKSAQPGLACLREMIAKEKTDTFFLFDGASLLATLDNSGASDGAILDGLARTDMQDVTSDGYIELCLRLSRRNVDIGVAAGKYLQAQNVTVYLPQHGAYKLDRIRGAILLYGSSEPALVDKYLIPELSSPDQEVRSTAAIILSQNLTEDSLKALNSLAAIENFSKEAQDSVRFVIRRQPVDVSKPAKYTRKQMLDKLARLPEMDAEIDDAENNALDNSIYATLTPDDVGALREGRRRMIVGVSNESVEGYEEMSRILLNLINVLDLYPKYRH